MDRKGKIIIVGAGFSKALSIITGEPMPLNDDFLELSYKVPGISSSRFTTLFDFIQKFWKITKIPDELRVVNIEDVLSVIDLRNENNEITVLDKTFSTIELKRELLYLIYESLDHYSVSITHSSDWLKLVSTLWSFIQKFPKQSTIISFNWDLIIDVAFYDIAGKLTKLGNSIYDVDFMYGFTPNMTLCGGSRPWIDPRRGDDMTSYKLLKLHGSINWTICSECQRIYIFELNRPAEYINLLKCPKDGASLNILLAPPSVEKNIGKFPFSTVWRKAFHELSNANEIVIIGFSLRDIDYHVRYLFQHSAANTINPNERKLILVDPQTVKGEFVCKFKEIFKVEDKNITTFKNLSDYFKNIGI